MTDTDTLIADIWATSLSPDNHPIRLVRDQLNHQGVIPIAHLGATADGTRIHVGGIVAHRQRPATARGVTFLNLEDETGMLNVIVSPGAWTRYRSVVRTHNALIIRGQLQAAEGVRTLIADDIRPLPVATRTASRDYR